MAEPSSSSSEVLEKLERLKQAVEDKYDRIDRLRLDASKAEVEIEMKRQLLLDPKLLPGLNLDRAQMECHQVSINQCKLARESEQHRLRTMTYVFVI
jgi:hypothetical protein